jgi:hypothetical protein
VQEVLVAFRVKIRVVLVALRKLLPADRFLQCSTALSL